MFSITIRTVKVLFSKFFGNEAAAKCLDALTAAGAERVVFVDTPATTHLVSAIRALTEKGIEVVVRDHHDCPSPRNPRESEIAAAAQAVRELVPGAVISDRATTPACSALLQVGEFAPRDIEFSGWVHGACYGDCPDAPHMHRGLVTVIVADPDPDGLTAAMKAVGVGVVYERMDSDAAVLDGPRSEQTAERLSPLALLLTKGLSTLPPFDPTRPQVAEEAKGKLFAEFVAAASGEQDALESLTRRVEDYEAAVAEAERLAKGAAGGGTFWPAVAKGVVYVDTVGHPRYDLTTLVARLESRPGCRVTVVSKDSGPIAAAEKAADRPAVQYSIAVKKEFQQEINLQELLPAGFVSSPEAGIVSNATFLLHVSEEVWRRHVSPGLKRILGRSDVVCDVIDGVEIP